MPEPPKLLNPPMLPIPMKVDPPDPGKVTGAGAAVVVVVVVVEVVVVVCHKIDIVWIHEYFETSICVQTVFLTKGCLPVATSTTSTTSTFYYHHEFI